MFYLSSTLNFGIPLVQYAVLVFQLEVFSKVDRLITGQQFNKKEELLDGIQINSSMCIW